MQLDYTVKPSLGQKLSRVFKNWRLMAFVGFFCALFGSLGYTIFSEVISNGIHYHGNVAEVNLKALGQFPLDDQNGILADVPKDYRLLDGKKVELKGFLFAGKSAAATVQRCQLVWNIQKCCFGGPPLVQERVFLVAPRDRSLTLYDPSTFVSVVGTLHVTLEKNSEGSISTVYQMVPDSITPVS